MGRPSRARGFTLVEIMIVILIIGLLLAIAVPQFTRARMRSQQQTCMCNLRQIEYAKDILAQEKNLADGTAVAIGDIWPDYIKSPGKPECPGGGVYTMNPIGESPSCSLNGGAFPHLPP